MSDELKKCPFCGSEAIVDMDEDWYWEWKAYCPKCGCDLGYFETKEEAIEAWNRRTQPPADQWIPCSFDIPKDGQHIIATFESNKGVKQVTEEYFHKSFLEDPWKMIAWYPFPEPYKGE